MDKRLYKFTIITNIYIALFITANLMATKLVSIFGMILPAAVIAYPFTFLLGDVLTEMYGFKAASQVILLGFFTSLIVVLWTALGIVLPYPTTWTGQAHYAYIFGLVPRIMVGSFIGYLFGETSNAWTMAVIKRVTGEQLLAVRTIGSSVVGQILDTLLFFGIAFYGTMPDNVLFTMMLTQYMFKVGCEVFAGTPMAYLLIGWIKRDEE